MLKMWRLHFVHHSDLYINVTIVFRSELGTAILDVYEIIFKQKHNLSLQCQTLNTLYVSGPFY